MIRSSALRLDYDCPIAAKVDVSRHCDHCNERVHDLSSMTEREVRALFRQHEGQRICIFYRIDANQYLELRPEPRVPSHLPALAMALSALACAPTVAEQHPEDPTQNVARVGTEIEVTTARRDPDLAERTRSFPVPSHSEVDRGAGWHDGDEVGLLIENPDAFKFAVARARSGTVEPQPEATEAACPVKVGTRGRAPQGAKEPRSDESADVKGTETAEGRSSEQGGFSLGGYSVPEDRLLTENGVTTQPTVELIRAQRNKARARRERRAQERKSRGRHT